MKHILSLSFTLNSPATDEVISFLGEKVRITHYGTNFDIELTKRLIKQHDGQVDVIAISGLPPIIRYGKSEFVHPTSLEIKHYARESILVDGQVLKEVYLPYAMKQFFIKNQGLLAKKRIGVYTAMFQKNLLEVFEESGNPIAMADPYYFLRLPFTFGSLEQLDNFIKLGAPIFKRMKLKRSILPSFEVGPSTPPGLKKFFQSDVFIGAANNISYLNLDHLENKILMVDFVTPDFAKQLERAKVNTVVGCLPHLGLGNFANYAVFEALLQAFLGEVRHLEENDILNWIHRLELGPVVMHFSPANQNKNKDVFAFIVHPLSKKHLFYHPRLKYITKNFPNLLTPLENVAEDVISMTPGFLYGRIKGIKSEKNGKEIEGLIYTVTETPKKLMEKDPEIVYSKLVRLSVDALRRGAQIIGLGAYTKIVGDAGVTVARRSPIPVTTGNSLSAASTLWAAKVAVNKMGMVKEKNGIMQGSCMVIGATGSIGAVSAKLLAQKWKRIILSAPRAYKLLELQEQIEQLASHCEVLVATDPNSYLGECDLIVTTTSSRGEKILDIMRVRPGCVICDVSRPFDIKEEDALKRPDVLVVASGEVELPGKIDINVNLGLHGNVVYACLAETALLAMEGRMESFTLSRNISYEKVLEIDRMAREHGVRLSHIMGHQGILSDEEFKLCREHALARISKLEGSGNPDKSERTNVKRRKMSFKNDDDLSNGPQDLFSSIGKEDRNNKKMH